MSNLTNTSENTTTTAVRQPTSGSPLENIMALSESIMNDDFDNSSEEKQETRSGGGNKNLFDLLASSSLANNNNNTMNSLRKAIGDVKEPGKLFLILVKLNEIEWKQVGLTETSIDSGFDARKKTIKDGSNNSVALKRLEDHRVLVKEASKLISLTAPEANFMSVSNLLKTDFRDYLNQLPDLFAMAYVKSGTRDTLEWAHNQWVPKVLDWKNYQSGLESRYEKICKLLKAGKAGNKPVDPKTHISQINPLEHAPRQWCAWVNPRRILKCRGLQGEPLTLEQKSRIKNWVASIEICVFKLGRVEPVKFDLTRFDKDGNKTLYWKSLVEAYVNLNAKIVNIKGPNEGKTQFVGWDAVDVGSYVEPTWFDYNRNDKVPSKSATTTTTTTTTGVTTTTTTSGAGNLTSTTTRDN